MTLVFLAYGVLWKLEWVGLLGLDWRFVVCLRKPIKKLWSR